MVFCAKSDGRLAARVLRSVTWFSFGNLASMALGFLVTVYVARTLGQSEFGKVSFAYTLALYASLIVDFGLNVYGSREVARRPDRRGEYLANIAGFQMTLSVFIISLSGLLIPVITRWQDPQMGILVFFSMLWLLPFALNIEWLFLGLESMATVSAGRLIQQAITLFLTMTLVRGPADLLIVPLSRMAGAALSALLLFLFLPRGTFKGLKVQFRHLQHYLKSSIFFSMSAILVQVVSGFGVLLLGILRSSAEVGIYVASYQLMALLTSVISLLNVSLFPILANLHQNDAAGFWRLRRLYFQLALALGIVVLISGVVLSSPLVIALFGDAYRASILPLNILVFAAACQIVNGAIAQPLLATGHERDVFWQIAGSSVLNVASNLLLVPHWGALGAAWSYLIAAVIGTLWVSLVSTRRFQSSWVHLLIGVR